MTILTLDQFSDLGGAQICLADLVPGILAQGWTVHAAAPDGPLLDRLKRHGATVHPLVLGGYSHGRKGLLDIARFSARLPAMLRSVGELAAKVRPDVVYVNGPRLMPAVALAQLDCVTVFHSHHRLDGAVQRRLVRAAIARRRACVVAVSSYVAAQWSSARVVYNGVDGPASACPKIHRSPCVGMIGRIAPQKRQKEFVLACSHLSGRRSDLRFLLCGDVLFGDRRGQRYKQELQRLVPPALRLVPWTDNVYDVLAELDLLVVPSSGEGGPRVVMEAFAAGVPVLANASGAIPELIAEGRTGFLLRSASADEIAGRISELVDDEAARARVAIEARSLWQERFSVARYREQMCRLLRELT
jgi:glycosyltransferase involved in cell wall biosynthesis